MNFNFTEIYNQDVSQEELFDKVSKPVILEYINI